MSINWVAAIFNKENWPSKSVENKLIMLLCIFLYTSSTAVSFKHFVAQGTPFSWKLYTKAP